MDDEFKPKGRPIAVDPKAESTDANLPAFIARPEGAPAYHGFVILDDVVVEGFTLGTITDFEAEPTDCGDGFVIAPDGSRCGLVWQVDQEGFFQQVFPPDADRWGVWGVSLPHPMDNRENARRNLEFILPKLKQEWLRWQEQYQKRDG